MKLSQILSVFLSQARRLHSSKQDPEANNIWDKDDGKKDKVAEDISDKLANDGN